MLTYYYYSIILIICLFLIIELTFCLRQSVDSLVRTTNVSAENDQILSIGKMSTLRALILFLRNVCLYWPRFQCKIPLNIIRYPYLNRKANHFVIKETIYSQFEGCFGHYRCWNQVEFQFLIELRTKRLLIVISMHICSRWWKAKISRHRR